MLHRKGLFLSVSAPEGDADAWSAAKRRDAWWRDDDDPPGGGWWRDDEPPDEGWWREPDEEAEPVGAALDVVWNE